MANIKELLANMIGKINGKLNAPEQAAKPNQQLVTDADGVAKWEDRLTTEEITQFPVNFTFNAGTKYLYDIVLTPEDIVFGEEYNFKIAPNGEHAIGGYTYRAVDEFIVSAIAQESSDREGNPAVEFEFSDVKMVQSFAGDTMAGYDLTLNSITFRKDDVFVSISEHNGGLMSSNEFSIHIETDMFHEHKIIKIDPKYLPESVTVAWDADNMDSTGLPAPSCSVPYDEFVSAVQSGAHVRGVVIVNGEVAMVGDAVALNNVLTNGEQGWLIELKCTDLSLGAIYTPDGTILHYG